MTATIQTAFPPRTSAPPVSVPIEPHETFAAFIPVPHENMTIAQEILTTTAMMKKAGTFETNSLCWSPAQLEKLAMFAIDAKYKLARLAPSVPLPTDPPKEAPITERDELLDMITELTDELGTIAELVDAKDGEVVSDAVERYVEGHGNG